MLIAVFAALYIVDMIEKGHIWHLLALNRIYIIFSNDIIIKYKFIFVKITLVNIFSTFLRLRNRNYNNDCQKKEKYYKP